MSLFLGRISCRWSLKQPSKITRNLPSGRSQISYFQALSLMYSAPNSNIPIWDGTGLYQPLLCLFTIHNCGILTMHLVSMIFVNTSLVAFIFQSSKRKLPPFQLNPRPLLLQYVTGMLASLFHISEFGVTILSICWPRLSLTGWSLNRYLSRLFLNGFTRNLLAPKEKVGPNSL